MQLSAEADWRLSCNPDGAFGDAIDTSSRSAEHEAVTFVAETRCQGFGDSSLVRTRAQSRAEIESPRARVPYMAGWEFPPATVVSPDALVSKRKRSLVAYGAPQHHLHHGYSRHRSGRAQTDALPFSRTPAHAQTDQQRIVTSYAQ